MAWVRMWRKDSETYWRFHKPQPEKCRVPLSLALVEVIPDRRYGRQARDARRFIRLAVEAGLMPEKLPPGSKYRLPLCVTRGCWDCGLIHREGACSAKEEA